MARGKWNCLGCSTETESGVSLCDTCLEKAVRLLNEEKMAAVSTEPAINSHEPIYVVSHSMLDKQSELESKIDCLNKRIENIEKHRYEYVLTQTSNAPFYGKSLIGLIGEQLANNITFKPVIEVAKEKSNSLFFDGLDLLGQSHRGSNGCKTAFEEAREKPKPLGKDRNGTDVYEKDELKLWDSPMFLSGVSWNCNVDELKKGILWNPGPNNPNYKGDK